MDHLPEKSTPARTSGDEATLAQEEEEVQLRKNHTSSTHGSSDEFTVFWEEPTDQDPENPKSWSTTRKASIIGTISFLTFLTPLASSMFAPGVPEVMEEFKTTSKTLATFVVSIYVLGFAFGKQV